MSDEQDQLLTEVIARHFPEARTAGNEIDLGFGGLSIACRVNSVGELGRYKMASLFFLLRGGRLADAPVFASMSGYGDSDQDAIVGGACNWACSFGPVLRAGLAGEADAEVSRLDVTADGQSYHLYVDGIDRMFSPTGSAQTAEQTRVLRGRLGGWPWLSRVFVDSGRLPLLPLKRPTILSVFVGKYQKGLTVEVKINGADWPGMADALADASNEPPGAPIFLRELAVLVPVGPPAPLQREAVLRTLAGLRHESRRARQWRGWRRHEGALAAPLSADQIAALEAELGPLPPDHRHFLMDVAASGAGPGYGLLAPTGMAQRRLAEGTFSFEDGASPDGGPEGVLALAHAGCGIVWYLVLRGPHAGEVWCDARSSDGKVRRVAGSFTDWYRDWLDASVAEAFPWTAWDWEHCATTSLIAQLLEELRREEPETRLATGSLAGRIGPGTLKLASGGGRCFAPGAPLDPCAGCVHMVTDLGLSEDVFAAGTPPLERREDAPSPPSPGGRIANWLRRLKGRID